MSSELSTWMDRMGRIQGGAWLDGNGTNVLGLCVGMGVRWRLVPLG